MKNLLIVDDNFLVLSSLKAYLETYPAIEQVFTASTIREAISIANQRRIDIALVDYLLREGDGLSLALELKKIDPRMKIAILSIIDKSKEKEPDTPVDAWLVKSENLGPLENFLTRSL